MNYRQLIDSIDENSGITGGIFIESAWATKHAKDLDPFESTAIIKRIIDIALSDPSAWYVTDRNGERVHVGDTVKVGLEQYRVDMVGRGEAFDDECFQILYMPECEKVEEDTREKIIAELAESFVWDGEDVKDREDAMAKAEAFYARIKAAEKKDDVE